jgi:hypothetical protein
MKYHIELWLGCTRILASQFGHRPRRYRQELWIGPAMDALWQSIEDV